MFKAKNTIENLGLQELFENCTGKEDWKKEVAEWAEKYGIKHKPWAYAQASARVAKWSISRGKDGLIQPREYIKANWKDPLDKGIYYWFSVSDRYLLKQTSTEGLPYCRLVPLLMMPHKQFNGIKYSDWGSDGLEYLVGKDLATLMTEEIPEYALEDIIEWRTLGVTVKSGDKMGTVKSYISTYGLNGLSWTYGGCGKGPAQLQQIQRMVLCQTWAAHPDNRHQYMILDPKSWDSMPPPLVETEVVSKSVTETVAPKANRMPWEL